MSESFSPPGFGPPQPTFRPPTHQPADMVALMSIANEVRDLAQDGFLDLDALQDYAKEHHVSAGLVLASLAFAPDLRIRSDEPVCFAACIGRCQLYGALPVVERLLELRVARKTAGKPGFGLIVRPCLDRCDDGAVVVSRSPHGVLPHPRQTPETIDELVAALCEDAG